MNAVVKLLTITTVGNTHKAFLLPFAQHFKKMGWIVDGMANKISDFSDCVLAYNKILDFPFERNPFKNAVFMSQLNNLESIVKAERYKIVHVHTPVAAFLARFALRKMRNGENGLKIVYTAHGLHYYSGSGLRGLVFLFLEKLASYWTDAIICINSEDFITAQKYRLARKQFYLPGIGIDLDCYQARPFADQAKLRQDLGLTGKKCIIMIAEFNPGKRHFDLIRALKLLKGLDVTLLLAGTGVLEDKLRKKVIELEIDDQVIFLGHRNDIPNLLSISECLVLPSEREGLPRCLLESMAVGTPCIGSDVRGINDLLRDDCGGLFPLGNVECLADVIKNALLSLDLRNKWRENAKRRIQHYKIDNVLLGLEDVYQSVLGEDNKSSFRRDDINPAGHAAMDKFRGNSL